jgi:hypothetical protein
MVSPLGPQPSASASSATSARKRRKYNRGFWSALTGRLRALPGVAWLESAYAERPRLVSWALLGSVMVLMMTAFSWGVGLAIRHWLALVIATVLTAWLSVWVVFQETDGQGE